MTTLKFIFVLCASIVVNVYGHVSPRDLATDVPIALTESKEFEEQRAYMDGAVTSWNTTYWSQSSNMNQALSIMEAEGVPTTELDSIRNDITNLNVNATNFVNEGKSELLFMQDMLADIIWDLENNYLDDLYYDNVLLNQSYYEVNRIIGVYDVLMRPKIIAIQDKVIAALTDIDSPGATQARALVNQSVTVILDAYTYIHLIHGPFNAEGTEAINAIDVVVSQVPIRRISKKHIRPINH